MNKNAMIVVSILFGILIFIRLAGGSGIFGIAPSSRNGTNGTGGTGGYVYDENGVCKYCGQTPHEEVPIQPHVIYTAHMQSYGNLPLVQDGGMCGTSGLGKRLENFSVMITDQNGSIMDPQVLGITYRAYCQSYGWKNWVYDGMNAGTSGESKRMEAIQIQLYGDLASMYDVYYCVHSQSYGWLAWAKNGETAGTKGLSKRIEAIEIKLVQKDSSGLSAAPMNLGTQKKAYIYK